MDLEIKGLDHDPERRKLIKSLSNAAEIELLPHSNELSFEWIGHDKGVMFVMIDLELKAISAALTTELSESSYVNGSQNLAADRRYFVRVNNESLDIRDPKFDRVKVELTFPDLANERQFLATIRRMHDSLLNRRIACHTRSFSLYLATPVGEG